MDSKMMVPDGKGGWTSTTVDSVISGAKADTDKQAAALKQTFINEAGRLTEQLLAFDRAYIMDNNLTAEHRMFAAALYCINLRETYRDETGKLAPEKFDAVAKAAADYYDEQTRPKK